MKIPSLVLALGLEVRLERLDFESGRENDTGLR